MLWNDVDSFGRLITVRRSKTVPGMWVIPMNDEACSAVALSNTEPTSWGSTHQSTMSFIGSGRRLTQPERWAVGDLRGAHSGGRGEASKEKGIEAIPRLAKLRFYDLRHQFVTELCEAGVPESVIRELCWSRGPRHDANLLPPESGRETGRG